MIRRVIIGLLTGFIVGGLVAAALVAGLKETEFVGAGGAVLAYISAAFTGMLTGLVAGKPIWAPSAKIEAGLKAAFGALLGSGIMFAMRQWAGSWVLDLTAISAGGRATVGALPAASLPLLAALLGGFFELDNTGGDSRKETGSEAESGARPQRKRVAAPASAGKARSRVLESGEVDSTEDEAVAPRSAKR
jgi:hypothetical protein